MTDIFIPAGARSANVVIKGGTVGSGMLYLVANGCEEIKISLEVISSRDQLEGGYHDETDDEDF